MGQGVGGGVARPGAEPPFQGGGQGAVEGRVQQPHPQVVRDLGGFGPAAGGGELPDQHLHRQGGAALVGEDPDAGPARAECAVRRGGLPGGGLVPAVAPGAAAQRGPRSLQAQAPAVAGQEAGAHPDRAVEHRRGVAGPLQLEGQSDLAGGEEGQPGAVVPAVVGVRAADRGGDGVTGRGPVEGEHGGHVDVLEAVGERCDVAEPVLQQDGGAVPPRRGTPPCRWWGSPICRRRARCPSR